MKLFAYRWIFLDTIDVCISFNRKAIQAGGEEGRGEPWTQKETDARVCNALYL